MSFLRPSDEWATARLAVRIAWEAARGARHYAAAACLANVIAALLEGSTIGVLGIALHVLGKPDVPLGASLGSVGRWVDGVRGVLGPHALFLSLLLVAVLAQILRSGLQFLAQMASASLQTSVHRQTYTRVFSHLLRLDFARVSRYRLGDLTHALSQATHLDQIFDYLNLLIRNALMLLSYGAVLLWLSWPITLAALVVYAMVSRLLQRLIATLRAHASRFADVTLTQDRRAAEFLQAIRLLHTFGRQEGAIQAMSRLSRDGTTSRWRIAVWSAMIEPITEVLTVTGIALFLVGGSLALGAQGAAAWPFLLTLLLALYRMTPRVGAIHSGLAALAVHAPQAVRIAEVLQRDPPAASSSEDGAVFPGLRQAIELRGVTLRYHPEEAPALAEVSCTVPQGKFTALVGVSGAGKSTVADLLLRLFEPTAGAVLVDGVDLKGFSPTSWRARVGVVSQETFLFHASVRENIAFGKPDATLEEVVAAAKQAYADEFIARLADGYETVIGDRGYRLSGGQRQRIALARALIRQPEILILDEATSALDSESERFIQQALKEQRGRRTLVVIAHRLSTIAGADQIVVLDAGRLVEQGTHEALLARKGIYARLWHLQSENHREPSGPASCDEPLTVAV